MSFDKHKTKDKMQKFVPPSHKHLTTQNQDFNFTILWWCINISMRKFGLQLISDFLYYLATLEGLVLRIFGMAYFHDRFIFLGKFCENLRPKCAMSCLNCLIFSESDS